MAVVYSDPRRRSGSTLFIADLPEWEPRAACYVCERHKAKGEKRRRCDRCNGTGFVGEPRPPGPMLGWDVAWSDEGHVRVIGPGTKRRKGEALYLPHACTA